MNLPVNKNHSYISVNLLKRLTHDQYEIPPGFDQHLKRLLMELEQKGHLKNTFLMILGDHGGRPLYYHGDNYKLYGALEYPNRFLSIKIPEVLKNTIFASNLKANKDKLMSSFDLHKTLKHIYMMSKVGVNGQSNNCRQLFANHFPEVRVLRGVSLFENVPQNRSCEDALIPVGFCTCAFKIPTKENKFIKETGLNFQSVGEFLISRLNDKTERLKALCMPYKLNRIGNFMRLNESDDQLKTQKYQAFLMADPGNSLFEAVVEINSNKEIALVDKIVRISRYGSQSDCLIGGDRAFKDRCFCQKKEIQKKENKKE